jgi:hypothetical protein
MTQRMKWVRRFLPWTVNAHRLGRADTKRSVASSPQYASPR